MIVIFTSSFMKLTIKYCVFKLLFFEFFFWGEALYNHKLSQKPL